MKDAGFPKSERSIVEGLQGKGSFRSRGGDAKVFIARCELETDENVWP
jgi:hypothetical protein